MIISSQVIKEKILFIVNPISGKGNSQDIIEQVNFSINKSKYDVYFEVTGYKGHAYKIADHFKEKGISKIIAIGGDGTVNEIGSAIINTGISLGIIPTGSGNGLARCLSIPLNIKNAIKVLNNPEIKKIDAGKINDKYFFCNAGIGFDAHVGKIFNQTKGRGFKNYLKTIIREYLRYKPKKYKLEIDGKKNSVKSFLITFSNIGQYGNNVFIAPDAKIDDGLLDVCILRPFPKLKMLSIGLRLISKTINKSKYLDVITCKEVTLKSKKKIKLHCDGESFKTINKINVKIMPESLQVMINQQ